MPATDFSTIIPPKMASGISFIPTSLGLAPVEVAGDGVGGDGILEAAAIGIALDHNLDEGLVDHVHFLLALTVGEIHLLTAHDSGLTSQIARHHPVEGDVGEGSLSTPAGGGVHTVDEGLSVRISHLAAFLS